MRAGGGRGPVGPQGPAGNDGAAGAQGIQGPAGNDGAAGADGADGAQGPQGDPTIVGTPIVGDVPAYDGTIWAPRSGGWTTIYDIDFSALTPADIRADGAVTIDGKSWTRTNFVAWTTSVDIGANGLEFVIPGGHSWAPYMVWDFGADLSVDWASKDVEIEYFVEITGADVGHDVRVGLALGSISDAQIVVSRLGNGRALGLSSPTGSAASTATKTTTNNGLTTQIAAGGFVVNYYCAAQTGAWLAAAERYRLGSIYGVPPSNVQAKALLAFIQIYCPSASTMTARIKKMRVRAR